jgi:hypothetical protein
MTVVCYSVEDLNFTHALSVFIKPCFSYVLPTYLEYNCNISKIIKLIIKH